VRRPYGEQQRFHQEPLFDHPADAIASGHGGSVVAAAPR
jgi:hypothetical protein